MPLICFYERKVQKSAYDINVVLSSHNVSINILPNYRGVKGG